MAAELVLKVRGHCRTHCQTHCQTVLMQGTGQEGNLLASAQRCIFLEEPLQHWFDTMQLMDNSYSLLPCPLGVQLALCQPAFQRMHQYATAMPVCCCCSTSLLRYAACQLAGGMRHSRIQVSTSAALFLPLIRHRFPQAFTAPGSSTQH